MSADIYDALAPHYREYAGKRSAYIDAVDAFVLSRSPKNARSLLDVGAGDGVRGMAIARRLGIDRVVLCDTSKEMAQRCRLLGPSEVWNCAAEEMPEGATFDVVISLWNVLGHIPTSRLRIAALDRMRAMLSHTGRIFIDVNNRHNAAAYGWLRVGARIAIDRLMPDERRGDTTFEWDIGGRRIPATGHLFTPNEIDRLTRSAGLHVVRRIAVDYMSGVASNSSLRGQLVYELCAEGKQQG